MLETVIGALNAGPGLPLLLWNRVWVAAKTIHTIYLVVYTRPKDYDTRLRV